ncbi:hypothetical protein H0A36_25925 [Endozoicomonas sp. SM1973]|uniref:Uncharacterized protein n=1 Tax=Spartinivicinus marinus TaxID=2994442 RepID=A0A853I9A9_9GAMM|nr:hypothetical protein [Spartinivicinus marinus]MCX4030380.1 hypothetical protein [Spartinivicinus marinus]MCX4030452.1 hypothetical protein [Spartinivicinus marinus]NYZ69459.1 hypothetical protein [Spartinivicinus marinus]
MNAVFKPITQAVSWSGIEEAFFLLLETPPTESAFQVMGAIDTLKQTPLGEFNSQVQAAWLQLNHWQRRLQIHPDASLAELIHRNTPFWDLKGLLNQWGPPDNIGQAQLEKNRAQGQQLREQLIESENAQLASEIQQLQQSLDDIKAPYQKSHKEISRILSDIREQHGLTEMRLNLEVEISLFNNKAKHRNRDYEALVKEEQAIRAKADHYQQLVNQYIKPVQDEWNQTALYKPDEATKQQVVETQQAINQKAEQLMSGVYDQLINQSTISAQVAQQWAKEQSISTTVINRLKKVGYSKTQLLKDMAEFYRLTHGRLSQVSVVSDGRKRAAASVTEGIVYVDGDFDKTTLFHEMAHLLENDPVTKATAQQFVESRKEGPLQPLQELAGNTNYRSDEKAYPDSFINPYVGKYYADGSTEVMSMGLEHFASSVKLYELFNNDPDMFDCLLGFLNNTSTAEQDLFKQIRQQKSADHDFYQQLFKRVKPIKITKEFITAGPLMGYQFLNSSTRDRHTGRKKTGRLVVAPDGSNDFMASELDAKAWAYLHQMNQQGIQSHPIENLKKLITHRQAPDWFQPGMVIPELKS